MSLRDRVVYKPRSIGPSTTINNPNYIAGIDNALDDSEIIIYRVHDGKIIEVMKKDGK
tara:strand:- start:420 stop:593 length:174 start_codon:yes stop_codon:yes gene_type:complete